MESKRKNRITLAVACCLIVLLNACQTEEKDIYFRFNELRDASWQQSEALTYSIDSVLIETGVPYSILIEVTNNSRYLYHNLWLSMDANFEQDSIYTTQTFDLSLADSVGQWRGAGFGSLYQTSFRVGTQLVFDQKRNYHVSIRHLMTDSPLRGIEKVGLRLQKD